MEEDEVESVIVKFLRNLGSVESDEVPTKTKEFAMSIGDAQHRKASMEELQKRAEADKTSKSVKDLMLVIYEMDFLTSGFSLNDPITSASEVHRMLQLGYSTEVNPNKEAPAPVYRYSFDDNFLTGASLEEVREKPWCQAARALLVSKRTKILQPE